MKELQPSLDYDDSNIKSCLYLNDDKFTVFLNEEALADLRWSLWWLASEAPQGEDVSISSFWKGKLAGEGTQIGYCEITLTNERKSRVSKATHKLRLEDDRLDLFVTREPAQAAFLTAQKMSFDTPLPNRTQIFGLLWIVLMPNHLWPVSAT